MLKYFRLNNTINTFMVFDQIGGSFELAEPIGQIFFFHVFGYLPKIKHSAFYCILMVWLFFVKLKVISQRLVNCMLSFLNSVVW